MSGLNFVRQHISQSGTSEITQATGDPVYISQLESGLYSVSGTWSIISGDMERTAYPGDLFIVYNDATKYRVMYLYSEGIEVLECPVGSQASSITICNIAPKDFITNIDNATSNLELPSALAVKNHTTKNVSSDSGVHGIRVSNGVIQYHNGTTWVTMSLDNFII